MVWRWNGSLIIALAVSVAGAQETNQFAATVQALLAERTARVGGPDRLTDHESLERIYPAVDVRPVWTVLDKGPTPQALAAIDVLTASDTRGLPTATYDVVTLRMLASLADDSRVDAARFDVALSRSMVRFIADLHAGRVDPGSVRFDMPNGIDPVEVAELVSGVARASDVPAAIARVEPPYADYRELERALARYRALSADTTLRPPQRAARTIRPGDRYSDVRTLTRLLRALGDLDTTSADIDPYAPDDSTTVYAGALVDAIVHFQRRHGLDPDAAIGQATMAQLRVPLAHRVRQIELTLERWRWLPATTPSRYVVVNIPAFRLHAFDGDSVAHPLVARNVIVGQAEGRHHTPVFSGTMREVVFRPYWDVPPRIARTELIPIFRRRPEYFVNERFEIVRRGATDAQAVTFPPTSQNLARIASGELRLRQRPGPTNALGLVKFVFPNRYNVYLHGTPAQELFARSRRDFSHGCIRIGEPPDLAELVLRGQSPWNRETIDSVINGTRTVHVPIARPFSVFVVYATVVADDSGIVSFYPDLYGHDAVLERALALPSISTRPSTDRR